MTTTTPDRIARPATERRDGVPLISDLPDRSSQGVRPDSACDPAVPVRVEFTVRNRRAGERSVLRRDLIPLAEERPRNGGRGRGTRRLTSYSRRTAGEMSFVVKFRAALRSPEVRGADDRGGGLGARRGRSDLTYFTVTVRVADPPRLLRTVTLCGLVGQVN